MNQKDIQALIKIIDKSDISEFVVQDGEFKLTIRTKHHYKNKAGEMQSPQIVPIQSPVSVPTYNPPVAAPITPAASPAEVKSAEKSATDNAPSEENLIAVKSPMVGTFYRSPGPDKPVFVKVGDSVSEGSVVCIVEAMKLFNEIESEVTGKIVKVLVEDATPVEYDQPLFLVDPKG